MEKFRQKSREIAEWFWCRVTCAQIFLPWKIFLDTIVINSVLIILYFPRPILYMERCLVNSLFYSHSSLLIKRYFNSRLAFVAKHGKAHARSINLSIKRMNFDDVSTMTLRNFDFENTKLFLIKEEKSLASITIIKLSFIP